MTKNSKNGKIKQFTTPMKKLATLCLLAACGVSEPQFEPTTRTSTEPILVSVIQTFGNACIGNAPSFLEANMNAAFSANQPALAPGMSFIASGQPGQSCRVVVRGYGNERPKPTVGDINSLGQALQAQVGGTISAAQPNGSGAAQVQVNGLRYNVFAYVAPDGDLSISVFE